MSISAEERVERVPAHVYRFVEKELYDYPANKILLGQYEAERQALLGQTPMRLDDVIVSGPGDPTLGKVLRLLRLGQRVERIKPYVLTISALLPVLADAQRQLVEQKYFRNELSNEGISNVLGLSKATYYRRRDDLVMMFARAMGLW